MFVVGLCFSSEEFMCSGCEGLNCNVSMDNVIGDNWLLSLLVLVVLCF